MCDCRNVSIGSYDNQVMFIAPEWSGKDFICVDTCIAEEIFRLWCMGVITYGCCCGHNMHESFVNVDEKDAQTMLDMGYVQNHPDAKIKDTFRLKSAG